jgi:hypothetical protein
MEKSDMSIVPIHISSFIFSVNRASEENFSLDEKQSETLHSKSNPPQPSDTTPKMTEMNEEYQSHLAPSISLIIPFRLEKIRSFVQINRQQWIDSPSQWIVQQRIVEQYVHPIA